MVNSKKLLSLFLAVVMTISVLSVMASAYSVGSDIDNGINFKYTVEKVSTVPATAASEEYSADNIYAVSVLMKASKGVDFIMVPVHFNKAHFAPITMVAGGVTYPMGSGECGMDDYYTYMGEGTVYAFSHGDYMNNTGMFRANGATAPSLGLAKCVGLGNSNSAGMSNVIEFVAPDHPNYSSWSKGLPENTGIMCLNLNVVGKTKTAYLNTVSGHTYSTDWIKMFTFYFETLEGVTDADVVGDEFGVYTADAFGFEGNFDGTGSAYYQGSSAYSAEVPAFNISGNAVVEAAAEPTVSHEMFMGRMDNWDDETATKFDAGFVGRITNLDPSFDAEGESQAIESIVVNITRGEKTLSGKAHQLYAQDDGSYLFRAVVLNADIADTTDLSYEYIVTLTTDADGDGKNDTVTYSSETPTSFNAIHAAADGRRPA